MNGMPTKVKVGDLVQIDAPHNYHNNRIGVVVEICSDDNEVVYVYFDDCGHRYGVAWLKVLTDLSLEVLTNGER